MTCSWKTLSKWCLRLAAIRVAYSSAAMRNREKKPPRGVILATTLKAAATAMDLSRKILTYAGPESARRPMSSVPTRKRN